MSAFDPERWPDPHAMLAGYFYRRLALRSTQWAIAEDLAGKVVKAVCEAAARGQTIDDGYIWATTHLEGRQYWQREHPKAQRTVYLSAPARPLDDEPRTVADTLAAPRSTPHEALAEAEPLDWSDLVPDVDWRPLERQVLALRMDGYSLRECDAALGLRAGRSNAIVTILRRRCQRRAA